MYIQKYNVLNTWLGDTPNCSEQSSHGDASTNIDMHSDQQSIVIVRFHARVAHLSGYL